VRQITSSALPPFWHKGASVLPWSTWAIMIFRISLVAWVMAREIKDSKGLKVKL